MPGLLVPTVADWCVVTVLEESERADSAVGALARAVRGGDLQAADAEAVDLVLEHLDDLAARHADPVRDELVQTYSRHRLQAYRGHARAAADGHEPVAPPFLVRALVSGAAQVVESGTTGSVQATMLPGPAAEALERLRPRTAVAVAVRARGRVLGVLSLCWDGSCSTAPASVHPRTAASPVDELGADPRVTGTARRPAGPGTDVLTFVQTVADRVGAAIDEARLVRAQVQIAETLQRALLTEPPQPDHAHVVTRYLPAAEAAQVGGDWYDAFLQEDGASVLVIGDVLGHDRTSTAAMGQVRTLVRAAAVMAGHGTGRGPAEVLTATDAALRTLRVGTIATSVVARLEQDEDLTRRGLTRLRWSTAGHPPPVLVSRSGVPRLLDGPGQRDLLLGVDPDLRRHESTVDVERGSTLLLYTDGLVERRGESLQVGLDRLLEAVGAAVAREPRDEDGYPWTSTPRATRCCATSCRSTPATTSRWSPSACTARTGPAPRAPVRAGSRRTCPTNRTCSRARGRRRDHRDARPDERPDRPRRGGPGGAGRRRRAHRPALLLHGRPRLRPAGRRGPAAAPPPALGVRRRRGGGPVLGLRAAGGDGGRVLAGRRHRARRRIGVVAALSVFVGNLVATELPQDLDDWVSAVLYGLIFATAPWALGELVVTRRELSRRLAEIDERAAREALERERAVLAREMHDVVSHQVSLIAVQAGALQVTSTDDPTRSAARTIRELSVRTLDELRSMVEVLRTAGGSVREDAPQPGVRDLDGLTAGCGLAVRSSLQVPDDLPAPVQRAVFRAVQEGLTNVRKHAPGAQVAVVVAHDGERTRVEVRNGPATEPAQALPSARHGLLGLRERAALLDGQVDAAPTQDGGFALVVTIPDP